MIAKEAPFSDLGKAISFSFEYALQYILAGILPAVVIGLFIGGAGSGILLILHLVSCAVLFPGAIVFNFVAMGLFPSRTWEGDRRRPRLAGWLGVPIVWFAVILAVNFGSDSRGFFHDRFGEVAAIFIHLLGSAMVGSSLSLACAWLLPPRPRVQLPPARRPSFPPALGAAGRVRR